MRPTLATRCLIALCELEAIRRALLTYHALREDLANHAAKIRAWRKAYRRHWQTTI